MERNRLDTADESITASINSLLKTVEDEIKTIRQAINDLINDDPDLDNRRNDCSNPFPVSVLQRLLIYSLS